MSWVAPRTWVTGETLTSTLLNTHLRDQLNAIGGAVGGVYTIGGANTDLIAPTNWAHTLNPTAGAFSVRTIAAPASAGQRLVLWNTSANPVAFLHATAGTGAQLFLLNAAAQIVLPQNGMIEFVYDGTNWRQIDLAMPLAQSLTQPANTANSAGTGATRMAGLARALTPVGPGGRVTFTLSGQQSGRAGAVQLYFGTGTAPVSLAAVTGTAITKSMGVNATGSFTAVGVATGLTPNTAYWFDTSYSDDGGGAASLTGMTSNVFEG